MRLLFALGLVLACSPSLEARQRSNSNSQQKAQVAIASDLEILEECKTEKPKQLYKVTRVVDGDTIWIERNGEREKLRLMAVDTEEKFNEGNNPLGSKPSTRYGDECTGWAQGFFAPRSASEGPVLIGMQFPEGIESRGNYGRLLCHVITADGVDFNLLLVRRGMSPYFNKYGNSKICHDRFLKAQEDAKRERRGIWNSRTNAKGSQRDYARLLPWWNARAEALNSFQTKAKTTPMKFVDASNGAALEAAFESGAKQVTALGSVFKFFEEDDGSRTVLMSSGDKKRSLRIPIPKDQLFAMKAADLESSTQEFRQNYLLVTGTITKGPRGYQLVDVKPKDWRRAGPEPRMP